MNNIDFYLRHELRPRHLRLLSALGDLQSVGKAAAQMNVTQPAISKTLAEIEKGLGLKLFDRTPRGITPTPYGECLIRHARQLLGGINMAREELHNMEAGERRRLVVGVLSNVIPALLPKSVALLKQKDKGINVSLREGTMERLMPHLLLGELDLIVGRPAEKHSFRWLAEKILAVEPIVLIAGPRHPLAHKRNIGWPELLRHSWVLPFTEGLLREPLERTFEAHGVPMPQDYVEVLSVQFMVSYLQQTTAIGTLTHDLAHYYRKQGQLAVLPFEFPPLMRSFGITWNQQRPMSESMKLFIACVEEAMGMGTPA